ncbi:MAG: serine/threonine-protein kinase, partial [Terriglobia bacterium]
MKRLGRYEILSELGHGAMGTVYRARDPQIDRIVALKIVNLTNVPSGMEDEFRQRFFREAQAAGRLSHPGIVTIHDVGEDEATRTPYLVMEFMEGKTLEQLGAGQRVPTETALDIVGQLAEALDYAHKNQIIHRDIKPANIIVTPDGRAKITDFGIAKLQTTQFTQPGQVLGTPAYMSPEQLTGGAVDGRSDLFCLGVVLYWMLTGDKPFPGDTTTSVSFKVVYQDPIPPTRLNPALSPDHDYLLQRALAKQQDERYQSGHEFADDLDDLKNGRAPRSRATAPAPPAGVVVQGTSVSQNAAELPAADRTDTLAVTPLAAHEELTTSQMGQKRTWVIAASVVILLLLILLAAGWWWSNRAGSSAVGTKQAALSSGPSDASGSRQPSRVGDSGSPPASQPPQAPARGGRKTTPTAEPRQRTVANATLRITGSHNFERATLYVYAN